MFNRSLQMKFVKTPKTAKVAEAPTDTTQTDYMQIARKTAKDVAVGAIAIVATYVVLDTLRQVVVNAAPTN